MYEETCEGCLTLTSLKNSRCRIQSHNYSIICPCGNCIVKMMCNKRCEDLQNVIDIVNQYWGRWGRIGFDRFD